MIERWHNICMNGSASYVSHWCDSNQQEKLKEGNIYLVWKLRVPSVTTGKSAGETIRQRIPLGRQSGSREQRLISLSPFCSVWNISSRQCHPFSECIFWKPRGMPIVILNQVKLTMKTEHPHEWWELECKKESVTKMKRCTDSIAVRMCAHTQIYQNWRHEWMQEGNLGSTGLSSCWLLHLKDKPPNGPGHLPVFLYEF